MRQTQDGVLYTPFLSDLAEVLATAGGGGSVPVASQNRDGKLNPFNCHPRFGVITEPLGEQHEDESMITRGYGHSTNWSSGLQSK